MIVRLLVRFGFSEHLNFCQRERFVALEFNANVAGTQRQHLQRVFRGVVTNSRSNSRLETTVCGTSDLVLVRFIGQHLHADRVKRQLVGNVRGYRDLIARDGLAGCQEFAVSNDFHWRVGLRFDLHQINRHPAV